MTRGKKATDAGLFELALRLRECNEPAADLEAEAVAFVNDKSKELGFDTPAKALAGACDIIAEEISDDAEVRRYLRELAFAKGALQSTVRKEFAEEKTKFQMYYDHKEPVKNVAGHRALAMFRGEREEVLRLELVVPRDEAIDFLRSRFVRHPKSASAHYLELAVSDSFDRLLSTATETEVRKDIREKAEIEAFSVFGSNLRALLMAAPAGHKAVLGIDPGFRTGCKVVALDDTGKLMEFVAIYPTIGREKDAEKVLLALFEKYGTKLVAIGNGTASRETDEFVRRVVETMPEDRRPLVVVVSEAGASVYSASEVAVREFPDQDVTVRGAVSIGRRLQDPLSELVKIDPKAIGVGQ